MTEPKTPPSQMLTKAEAANYFGVTIQTISRWIASKRLGVVRVGPAQRVRVPRAALEALLVDVPAVDAATTEGDA